MVAPNPFSIQASTEADELGEHGLPRRHFKTDGEHRFNNETYRRIGYYANVGISLASIFAVERTHVGQRFITALGRGLKKLHVPGDAEQLARKSFFLTGGFAVVPFMKWREDDKVALVKQYNREIYGPKADRDPTIMQSEYELEQAPKQSWASIISGRLIALVPFYITVGLMWEKGSALGKALGGWGIDRPISNLSRDLGKLWASSGKYFDHLHEVAGIRKVYHGALSGVGKLVRLVPEDKAAVAQIEAMEQLSPGAVKSMKDGKHDPNHAVVPYYFISEAITSAMVAWGIFLITRVTGPFFDRKPRPVAQQAAQMQPDAVQQDVPSPAVHGTTVLTAHHQGKLQDAPQIAAAIS